MSLMALYDRAAARAYAWTRAVVAPETRNSQYAYRDLLRDALHGTGRWLDLGCGHAWLPEWMPPADRTLDVERWTTVGIDMDAAAIARHRGLRHRAVADGERLPFADASFDLVSANMVVEHVAAPDALFAEVGRVLAPGGRFLLHTPNVHGYTTAVTRLLPGRWLAPLAAALLNRRSEDVYPTVYRANSEAVLRRFGAGGGLTLSSCALLNSSPQTVRVPPLMAIELLTMRLMRWRALARYRACLLVAFTKPAADGRDRVAPCVSSS